MAEIAKPTENPAFSAGGLTLKLRKPLTVHGEAGAKQIDTLTLREPTGRDTFEIEMPYRSLANAPAEGAQQMVEMVRNAPALRKWICRLSGLDGGAIDTMAPSDINKCFMWLVKELNDEGN